MLLCRAALECRFSRRALFVRSGDQADLLARLPGVWDLLDRYFGLEAKRTALSALARLGLVDEPVLVDRRAEARTAPPPEPFEVRLPAFASAP